MKKTIFDIFIPVGGLGKRLGVITKRTPKPLIKINNEEFIIKVINSLLKLEIVNINLLTSYKDKKFHFLKKIIFKKKFNLRFIKDIKLSGTFNSLYNCKKLIKRDFIYSNADEILDLDINKMIKIFEKQKIDVLQFFFEDKKGIKIDKKIIINKSLFKNNKKYTEGGLKIFKKNIFKNKKELFYSKIEDFLYQNKKSIRIKYYIIKKKPYSIDTWKRIARTKIYLKKSKF